VRILLDADSLIYRAGFTVEHNVYHLNTEYETIVFRYKKEMKEFCTENDIELTDDVYTVHRMLGTKDEALNITDALIAEIRGKFPSKSPIEIYLTGDSDSNFRKVMCPWYKENRKDIPKPVYYDTIRDYLIYRGAVVTEGYEADDAVCMRAWDCIENNEEFIIVSEDKDLLQIPGVHYIPSKDKVIEVDELNAWRNFFSQFIIGDRSDNIPGLPGKGEKFAFKKLGQLESAEEMEDYIKHLYKQEYGDDGLNIFTERANMFYLLREPGDSWRP